MWPPPGTSPPDCPQPMSPSPPSHCAELKTSTLPARGLGCSHLGPTSESGGDRGLVLPSLPLRAWSTARRRGPQATPLCLDNSAQTRQGNPGACPLEDLEVVLIPFSPGLPSVFIFVQSHLHKQELSLPHPHSGRRHP